MDPFASFKATQKQGWQYFAPLEVATTPAAAQLVKRAAVSAGQRVLDVACGTGVVAITAGRLGAHVSGLDLTPELLARAREHSQLIGVDIEWIEGDAEALPFPDASFDAVLSQFGHIFAPRPDVALGEMLRVLKPAGTLAFSTWPPDLFVGRTFELLSRYLPPPPPGASSPALWGDPKIVRDRLGSAVRDVKFDFCTMLVPALSPQHHRAVQERTVGPAVALVESLSASDPERLAAFRREYETISADYFADNVISLGYMVTRATKVE
jgi:SAM-dependent methyltransferase